MNPDTLLDAIGEAKDSYIQDVRKAKRKKLPRPVKWIPAAAAGLALVLVVSSLLGNLGAQSGSGGNSDLNYMRYIGPVLPLTTQGTSDGITATRNVDFDFSRYRIFQEYYLDENGQPVYYDRYDASAVVTDSYVLTNQTDRDLTVTLQYPFTGDMYEWVYYPTLSVNGETVAAAMYPGPYSGGFEGVWGSDGSELLNLVPLENFEGYQTLLSSGDYKKSAFDSFPVLDQTVYVYRLHDYVYTQDTEARNPTLSFSFYMDYAKTTVLSYGMNGASWDPESGFCSRRTGGIAYRPNVTPEHQHPEVSFVILLGEDLESYTLQGYRDGGCEEGEELEDLSCTVTRYETTLGEIMAELLADFLAEKNAQREEPLGEKVWDFLAAKELYFGLSAELLCTYGVIGDMPVERYELGRLEEIFSESLSNSRVIYLAFEVTVPAGGSITVEAVQIKDASRDYYGEEKNREGFDMATRLGSDLDFTEQTASISRFEEIEILAQNFGFDPENGVTGVVLDPDREHYWIQVRKRQREQS